MAIIVPSASEQLLGKFALGVLVPGNQELHLHTNNVSPDDTFVAGSFTELGVVQGYVKKTLTKTSWTWNAGSTGQPATGTYATQTWTADGTGGAQNCYGYYVTDVTTGLLLWCELFAAVKSLVNNGDAIIVVPTLTLSRT